MLVLYNELDSHIDKILAENLNSIFDKLGEIEAKLSKLGNSEEDRLERIVLNSMRRILLNDLQEIAGFSNFYGYELKVEPSLAIIKTEIST